MPSYPELKLYVGGEWRGRDGAPVINPADESILGTVPHATKADLDDALSAAEEGFKVWRNTSPAKRAQIIQRAAQICREPAEEDGVAITLEQGQAAGAGQARNHPRHRHHRLGCDRRTPRRWPRDPQ
jgi:succinate-semialdehyde dehydrogenase/glutarate-semialdehyde dehydrogenase